MTVRPAIPLPLAGGLGGTALLGLRVGLAMEPDGDVVVDAEAGGATAVGETDRLPGWAGCLAAHAVDAASVSVMSVAMTVVRVRAIVL